MNKNIIVILVSICFFICFSNIAHAREFIDYKNDIKFDIKNDYEIIRSDEKLYGFQNDEYKVVYSVIENGQITDMLDFSSFDEVTDERIVSTINNMGLNPLGSDIELRQSFNFSKFALFEGKSGELKSYKVIFYDNNKFYIFQIVSLAQDELSEEEYFIEMTMITNSIIEYVQDEGSQNFYYEEARIEEGTPIELLEDTSKANDSYIIAGLTKLFKQEWLNINMIIYVLGNLIAILLLRKFVVIFEYSYVKYPVAIILGYFGYKVCENFCFSMDYLMNKTLVITCIIVVLCLVLLPKRHKKKKSIYN